MGGMTMTVDLAQATNSPAQFPVGVYEARILNAENDVSSTGNPMIAMKLEIHHPTLGNAEVRDWLPFAHAGKCRNFWQAINDMTHEDLQAQIEQAKEDNNGEANVELDPEEFIGQPLLVNIGEKADQNDPSKVYKNVVAPWYFPPSRAEDLVTWGSE